MQSRAQTAAEYLILFAIVALVVVSLVVVLGGVPGGTNKSDAVVQVELQALDIGVSSYVLGCDGFSMQLQNNQLAPIVVKSAVINGTTCDFADRRVSPGQSVEVSCAEVYVCTADEYFDFEFSIAYQSGQTGVNKTMSNTGVTLQGVASSSGVSYIPLSMLSDLQGFWDGTGNGTHVYDVYRGNHGELVNVTLEDDSGFENSMLFPGNFSYVELANNVDTHPNATTISWWMRVYYDDYMNIFAKSRNGANGQVDVSTNVDALRLESNTNNVWSDTNIATGVDQSAGGWHHYVFRMSPQNGSLFVDGVLSDTTLFNDDSADFRIRYFGAEQRQSPFEYGGYLNGTLDEVAIWNRSLSDVEIIELYERSSGFFS